MAITDLFWGCPQCGAFGSLRRRSREVNCSTCGAVFRRAAGAQIASNSPAQGREIIRSAAEWTDLLPAPERLVTGREDPGAGRHEEGGVRYRASVIARFAEGEQDVRRGSEFLGRIERLGPRIAGELRLHGDGLVFRGPDGTERRWHLDEITAVQPSSSTLQLKFRKQPVVSLRFETDSVRLWEALLEGALRRRYRELGLGEILEFQPRIVTDHSVTSAIATADSGVPAAGMPVRLPTDAVARYGTGTDPYAAARGYHAIRKLVLNAYRLISDLHVEGVRHIPTSGPFILVANHQSVLDPVLIQAACPRPLHTMAKSTQFSAPLVGAFMKRYHSFPVRRYQIDPQAVRIALRRLAQGHGVGIYPEGERSWDGRLQPLRLGSIRLILKAGVPVVPCVIQGSYEAWPRWDRRFVPWPVRIAFGEPISFPKLDDRHQRAMRTPETADRILQAFRELLSEAPSVGDRELTRSVTAAG